MSTQPVELSLHNMEEAVLKAWAASGEPVRGLGWDELHLALPDLPSWQSDMQLCRIAMVPGQAVVECMFVQPGTVERAREAMSKLASSGWQVHILLPMGLLGEAHEALRGLRVKLHGAWSSDSNVYFTTAEIP